MEVVVTTGATISRAKLQSNYHHQQTNVQFLLQAGCASCHPTNSVKALKGKGTYQMPFLNLQNRNKLSYASRPPSFNHSQPWKTFLSLLEHIFTGRVPLQTPIQQCQSTEGKHDAKLTKKTEQNSIHWTHTKSGYLFNTLTLSVGWQEGHPACRKLGVGLLVVTIWLKLLHLLAPVVTTTSIILNCSKTS